MNERMEPVSIRRILVAVDASRHSRAALEAAVQMAARFQAHLEGLFVEDINVLRAAQLPFAQELGNYSARRRRMDSYELERHYRFHTRRMRRLFRMLTARESVEGSFHVTRGMVQSEIRSAAAEADVLIIGRVGWSEVRIKHLGPTARAACCDETPSVTVVLQDDARLLPPVLVVYDGSAAGDKALLVGATLVDETAGPLQVLLVGSTSEETAKARMQANQCLRATSVTRRYRSLEAFSKATLVRAIRESKGGTLILPAQLASLRDGAVPDLVEEINIPVLLVR